jgi:uroporphyrinogen III methyltransferase/synthase
VVQVSPLTVVLRFAAVKEALAQLGEVRLVAFASAHAVDAVVGALMAAGHDVRALGGVRLAAVGAATARRLEERQLRADLVSTGGGGAALAEEIIQAGLPGPVLLPRAAGGRDELAAALTAAGYQVRAVDAYETLVDEAALARVAAAQRAQPFDAFALASPKGARALLDALGAGALAGACVGAIGETTRQALVEAGVRVEVVPPEPDLEALVDAICLALAGKPKIE